MRICAGCRRELEIIWFHKNGRGDRAGRKKLCRDCYAHSVRLRERFREKLAKACEVCGSEKQLCLDEDHSTGQLRGTLCQRCNAALGRVDDDPGRLEALAAYLRRPRPIAEQLALVVIGKEA